MDELNPAVRRYIVGLAVAAAAILLPSMVLSARVRSGEQLLYAGLLGAGLLAAHHFPVHLTEKTKVYVDTALLFAAVLLLSPALAIATAAAAAAIHELVEHVSWQQGSFNVAQTVLYVA